VCGVSGVRVVCGVCVYVCVFVCVCVSLSVTRCKITFCTHGE